MTPILTADSMRRADRRAIEDLGIPGLILMENAARGACDVLLTLVDDLAGLSIAILCGRGNNGGDGFGLARHALVHGAEVTCVLLGPADGLEGDAAEQYRMLLGILPEEQILSWEELELAELEYDVLVDAMLGTGASGPLRAPYAAAVRWANGSGGLKLALDIPTGIDADTGTAAGEAFAADATATMGAMKPGLLLNAGAECSGDLYVVHIGVPPDIYDDATIELLDAEHATMGVPIVERSRNKYDRGKILVLAGSAGMTGAAVMTATAALRSGSGLVVSALPEGVIPHGLPPEAMTRSLPAADGAFAADALEAIAGELDGFHAIAVGPGLSKSAGAAETVRRLLRAATAPIVLDADGLSAFAGAPEDLAEGRTCDLVITPHHGEMARLLGTTKEEIVADPIATAREAARRCNAVAVLKGAPTIVATPDGRAWINSTGNPGMATAGTGDVLVGVIVSLIGQGAGTIEGTLAAVHLHSLAGDLAAGEIGVRSLLATDIIDHIPGAYQTLLDA